MERLGNSRMAETDSPYPSVFRVNPLEHFNWEIEVKHLKVTLLELLK